MVSILIIGVENGIGKVIANSGRVCIFLILFPLRIVIPSFLLLPLCKIVVETGVSHFCEQAVWN